ncbi:MAG: DnaB-like helicase N-terminal domain-containing protein, partial [Phycisphaerales bacterium]
MNESSLYEAKSGGSFQKGKKSNVPDMGKLFDRTPPHHVDAERSLLGSILLDPTVLNDVVEMIPNAEPFYQESHGVIYQTLVDTYEAHQTGDLVQLTESLRAKGLFDQVGGADYLMELAEAVPSAANAPYYAKLIADSARLRKLIDA